MEANLPAAHPAEYQLPGGILSYYRNGKVIEQYSVIGNTFGMVQIIVYL